MVEGLTLYFLPPYSPELNRIERLWQGSLQKTEKIVR